MVFYVVRKPAAPRRRAERYGPFESEEKAKDEAARLAALAHASSLDFQVVCDFG